MILVAVELYMTIQRIFQSRFGLQFLPSTISPRNHKRQPNAAASQRNEGIAACGFLSLLQKRLHYLELLSNFCVIML